MTKFILGNANFGLLLWCSLCGFAPVSPQVELPPRVTWRRESQEIIIIREGRGANYVINCTAEGYPAPTFVWKKDDQVVGDNQDLLKAFSNGTLYFKDFNSRENGLYQCLATNSFGTSLSAKVPLVIEKPPGPSADPNVDIPVSLEVKEGELATLKCADTPKTIPEYVKRWYFEKGSAEVELNSRVGTDSEGNLRFAYLELTDDATYVCALAPRVAHGQGAIQLYNTVILRVKPGNKVLSEPRLEFSSGNGYVKAFLNQTVTLECFFSGHPLSTITWKNTSNQIITKSQRFSIEDNDRQLIIKEVRPEDEGRFSCTANNGHGEKTEFINVNVTSPPFKVPNQGLTSLIQPDHSDVSLRCQAKAANGESLDIPVWYRNGNLIREENLPDPARYSFSTDRTQLHIRNLSKTTDTACFQCNVTNSEGYTFYDGFIKVIDSIVVTKRPKEVNEITTDDVIDISVLAYGDSCCQIDKRWYLNEKPLTPEDLQMPPFESDLNTDSLIFNATDVSDATLASWYGQYRCRVSNNYQEVNVQFSISKKGEIIPATASTGFELWWLAIILGVLAIVIAILIIVCCVKRNYPGETYQLEKTELKHHLNPEEELLDQSFQEF